MMEIFIVMASLGLVPFKMRDITWLEPSGDPFTSALRFLTSGGWNREETSPVEQGTSAEEGMNAAMPERQKQVCGEEPLHREQVRIPAVKTSRSDPPEKMTQSTDSMMDFQDSPSLLGSQHQKVCNECGSVFTSSYNLIRHKKVHLTRKQCECKECSKVYCNSSSLHKHRKIHRR
ncbi:hypothetical protein U0070_008187 [Myodes glareolus]|uniref:C2H2-type domain-containing protein n=1 Tax=Myodes glareolus TaxID=447135 RepID=A0AAW0HQ16_MYOGA